MEIIGTIEGVEWIAVSLIVITILYYLTKVIRAINPRGILYGVEFGDKAQFEELKRTVSELKKAHEGVVDTLYTRDKVSDKIRIIDENTIAQCLNMLDQHIVYSIENKASMGCATNAMLIEAAVTRVLYSRIHRNSLAKKLTISKDDYFNQIFASIAVNIRAASGRMAKCQHARDIDIDGVIQGGKRAAKEYFRLITSIIVMSCEEKMSVYSKAFEHLTQETPEVNEYKAFLNFLIEKNKNYIKIFKQEIRDDAGKTNERDEKYEI